MGLSGCFPQATLASPLDLWYALGFRTAMDLALHGNTRSETKRSLVDIVSREHYKAPSKTKVQEGMNVNR